MPHLNPRLKIGDRVHIIRHGLQVEGIATVIEVDVRPIIPHYTVRSENGELNRYPEFDLIRATEDPDKAETA